MKGSLLRYSIVAVSLVFLFALPLLAQKGEPPKTPSQPAPAQPGAPVPAVQTGPAVQNPPFVYGKILTESGVALPDSTSIELDCATQYAKAVHPELNGTFQFDLRATQQSDEDMSAAVNPSDGQGMAPIGPMNAAANSGVSPELSDCNLRISAPGYQPLSKFVDMHSGDVGGVNMGTVVLSPTFIEQSSEISVGSLMVPKKAQKEYQKGENDLRRSDLPSATHHLEKAVADYDKFAPAWNDLGRIYLSAHQNEKAGEAFTKAIAADSGYVPAYLNLAELQIQAGQYADAAETAGKALAVQPGLPPASYLEALADFKLNRFAAAEQNARDAERAPHENIPQLHLLLTDILLQTKDYSGAVQEMQSYVKEYPNGRFVGEVKTRLPQIEKLAAEANAQSPAPQTQPQSARPSQTPSAQAAK